MHNIRVAQVAPLYETVPPGKYGGIERAVHWLTEGLVRAGHDVTLFASRGSKTSGSLQVCCKKPLRLDPSVEEKGIPHLAMMEKLVGMQDEFDIVHFHTYHSHLPYLGRIFCPALTTVHNPPNVPYLPELYSNITNHPFVPISESQRRLLPSLNWEEPIHYGMPPDTFSFNNRAEDYLVFVGRFSPGKRPDRAIEIARQFGMRLKIAAKIDPNEIKYYEKQMRPLLEANAELVEYVGEVSDEFKQDLIGNAYALVHPVEFPEPFGIVLIEAMACGTPVIAFGNGAIPEVVDDGISGFVVEDIPSAVEALRKVPQLNRRRCRRQFERRFSVDRMVEDYLALYKQLIDSCAAVV